MQKKINEIRKFNKERDWDQFHTKENLDKSISDTDDMLSEYY